jgi:hypothetical protein
MIRAALGALVLIVSACQPGPPDPSLGSAPADSAPGETWRAGTVRITGSAPMDVRVVIQEEGQRDLAVAGPLAEEIARLAGAEVAIRGRVRSGSIEASDYSVRALDGRPAVVGVVERTPGGDLTLRTRDGRVLPLSGATAELRPGQKVWVQGPEAITVQAHGVLRP